MSTLIGWISLVLALVYVTSDSNSEDHFFGGNNICPRIEKFEKSYTVPKTKKVKETRRTWCFAIPPTCTVERIKTISINETVKVNLTRTVHDCCKGYEMQDGVCIPLCKLGCGNGECIAPDICLCDEGWREPFCSRECEPNHYGRGCMLNCTCLNGGTCDRIDGSCSCTEGFIGTYCETPCLHNKYGKDCKENCLCENGGVCDIKDGACDCDAGYYGEYCEHRCEPGYHGEDCKYDCVCIPENTHSCDHVDGECVCMAGYTGQFCERECDNFTYGKDCKSRCKCMNGDYCNHITGVCYCKPGWTGGTCSEICPSGKFGENCTYHCAKCPSADANCNHVTGYCDCPPGTFGNLCDTDCSEGYWGTNCTSKCECINNEKCNATAGGCTCPPGLTHPNCSEICFLGWYGDNCSFACNCSNEKSCDAKTGSCISASLSSQDQEVVDGVLLGTILAVIGCLFIIAVFSAWKYRVIVSECRYFLRRNTEESGSTDAVIDHDVLSKPSTFSNPLYERPGNIQITHSITGSTLPALPFDSGFQAAISQTGNMRTKDEGQTPSEPGNENTKEERQTDFQRSIIRRSANTKDFSIDYPENKRNSKRLSDKNSGSVYSSNVTIEDDCVPEVLGDFKIPEDDTYDTVLSVCRKVINSDQEGTNNA